MMKSSAEKPTGNNDCRYRGIRKRNWGKWVTEIRLPNSRERIWLGSYDTAEKAARAFDAAAFCLRGPTAKFNFPMNPSAIAVSSSSSLSAAEIQAVAAKYANEGAANPPEQEQRVSELASPSLASNNLSTLLDSELDWSFLELHKEDSGNNRFDFRSPSSSIDHFLPVHDLPAVDLDEELEFYEEGSFLWSF